MLYKLRGRDVWTYAYCKFKGFEALISTLFGLEEMKASFCLFTARTIVYQNISIKLFYIAGAKDLKSMEIVEYGVKNTVNKLDCRVLISRDSFFMMIDH